VMNLLSQDMMVIGQELPCLLVRPKKSSNALKKADS